MFVVKVDFLQGQLQVKTQMVEDAKIELEDMSKKYASQCETARKLE